MNWTFTKNLEFRSKRQLIADIVTVDTMMRMHNESRQPPKGRLALRVRVAGNFPT